MSHLTVPRALFFGRRGRANDSAAGPKEDALAYAPPPPFIPLNSNTYKANTPALLHAFYASRIESGAGLDTDDAFDQTHATIGPLGQIVQKPLPGAGGSKKSQAKKDDGEKKERKPAKRIA